jgi:hypothetical protein
VGEWRPIESAPTDGSLLLLGNGREEWVTSGRWIARDYHFAAGWYEHGKHPGCDVTERLGPTHWQAFPELPPREERSQVYIEDDGTTVLVADDGVYVLIPPSAPVAPKTGTA